MTFTGAVAPLSQCCQVGVITNQHRHMELFFQQPANRQVDPTRNVGGLDNDPLILIQVTRYCHYNRCHPGLGWPNLFKEPNHAFDGRLHFIARANFLDPQRNGVPRLENGCPNLCPAYIRNDIRFHARDYSTEV